MSSSSGGAQTKKTLGIAVGKFRKIICTEALRQTVERIPASRVGTIGVANRKEKMTDADHLKSTAQRRLREVAAGCAMNVGLEVIGDRLAMMGRSV